LLPYYIDFLAQYPKLWAYCALFAFKKTLARKERRSVRAQTIQKTTKGKETMNANESLPVPGLADFFAAGKMDSDFEVHETHVNGICVMYPTRSSLDNEFMIREKSMVSLKGRDIEECVQRAKDLAYESAISRLRGVVIQFPQARLADRNESTGSDAMYGMETETATDKPPVGHGDIPKEPRPKAAAPQANEPEPPPPPPVSVEDDDEESASAPIQGTPGEETPDKETPATVTEPDDVEPERPGGKGTVEKFDLDLGLQPASNLLGNVPDRIPTNSAAADVDPELEKAMNLPITILGKLHECYGKTAGEILQYNPKCIVDFAHRYTGPKKDEKDALLMLYPEAVRRVNQAAA